MSVEEMLNTPDDPRSFKEDEAGLCKLAEFEAIKEIYKKLWLQHYEYEPTMRMMDMMSDLDVVKAKLKRSYCFITLRPHRDLLDSTEAAQKFEDFCLSIRDRFFVCQIKVDEHYEGAFEGKLKDGDWHYHCIFKLGRNIGKAAIIRALRRGNLGKKLFGHDASIDVKKIPECEYDRVRSYVLKGTW